MKFSGHLYMFWKYFKENKDTIFLVYINEHIPPIIMYSWKVKIFCRIAKAFTRSPKRFHDIIFIDIRVRRKIRTVFLRKHAKTIPRRYQQLVRCHWCCSGVFIVNCDYISHLFLMLLLLTLSMYLFAGCYICMMQFFCLLNLLLPRSISDGVFFDID